MIQAAGPRLASELERLAAMDMDALGRRWRQVFGQAAPPGLSRALLHRTLAYRIPALALGDLHRETIRALERFGGDGRRSAGSDARERGAGRGGGQGISLPLPDLRGRLPGTLLAREWSGTMHTVMVLAQGYAWNGTTYDSLPKVAQAITGTKWNGPRFFGLRERAAQDRSAKRAPRLMGRAA